VSKLSREQAEMTRIRAYSNENRIKSSEASIHKKARNLKEAYPSVMTTG